MPSVKVKPPSPAPALLLILFAASFAVARAGIKCGDSANPPSPAPPPTSTTANSSAFAANLQTLLKALPQAAAPTGFASLSLGTGRDRAFVRGLCRGDSAQSTCLADLIEAVQEQRPLPRRRRQQLVMRSMGLDKWRSGKAAEMADASLGDHYPRSEMLNCVHIGLLCVQKKPSIRPDASEVVLMLSSQSTSRRTPSRPAFYSGHSSTSGGDSRVSSGNVSENGVTMSELQPR